MQHYAMLLNKLVDLGSLQCLDVQITFICLLDKNPYRYIYSDIFSVIQMLCIFSATLQITFFLYIYT